MQNILEFSRHLNWIDILVAVVFLRLIFESQKQGLEVEFFKILGTFSALYLALHYYSSLAVHFTGHSGSKNPPGHFLELVSYLILFFIGYLVFWLIRSLIVRVITAQTNPVLNKWGGVGVGFLRALFLSSLILFALLIPRSEYFKESVRYSLSGPMIVRVAPATYTFLWERIISKFNSGDKFNNAVPELVSPETKLKKSNN